MTAPRPRVADALPLSSTPLDLDSEPPPHAVDAASLVKGCRDYGDAASGPSGEDGDATSSFLYGTVQSMHIGGQQGNARNNTRIQSG